MKHFITAIALSLVLAGCSGVNSKPTDAHPAYYGCLTATGAAGFLTAYNNRKPLPKKTQDAILVAVNKIDPICNSPTPYTNAQLQSTAFQEAAALLVAEAVKLGAKQ